MPLCLQGVETGLNLPGPLLNILRCFKIPGVAQAPPALLRSGGEKQNDGFSPGLFIKK